MLIIKNDKLVPVRINVDLRQNQTKPNSGPHVLLLLMVLMTMSNHDDGIKDDSVTARIGSDENVVVTVTVVSIFLFTVES